MIKYRRESCLGAPRPGARALIPGSPCPVRRAPAELPDSGGALPRVRRLNTERRAASGAPRRPELSYRTGCVHGSRDARRAAGPSGAQLSSGPRRRFFLYSIAVTGPPCPSRANVEIVVMSDPTISSSTLLSWPREATLICYRHKYHRHELDSILSSRGPSQAKVGEAMNTNSPAKVSW